MHFENQENTLKNIFVSPDSKAFFSSGGQQATSLAEFWNKAS